MLVLDHQCFLQYLIIITIIHEYLLGAKFFNLCLFVPLRRVMLASRGSRIRIFADLFVKFKVHLRKHGAPSAVASFQLGCARVSNPHECSTEPCL